MPCSRSFWRKQRSASGGEGARRFVDHREAAPVDADDRELAVDHAVGVEAKQAIAPEEAVRVGQGSLGKRRTLRSSGQYRRERRRIVCERGEARRRLTERLL